MQISVDTERTVPLIEELDAPPSLYAALTQAWVKTAPCPALVARPSRAESRARRSLLGYWRARRPAGA
jgi:hypothetical protein